MSLFIRPTFQQCFCHPFLIGLSSQSYFCQFLLMSFMLFVTLFLCHLCYLLHFSAVFLSPFFDWSFVSVVFLSISSYVIYVICYTFQQYIFNSLVLSVFDFSYLSIVLLSLSHFVTFKFVPLFDNTYDTLWFCHSFDLSLLYATFNLSQISAVFMPFSHFTYILISNTRHKRQVVCPKAREL